MKLDILINNTKLTPEQQEFLNLHNKGVQAANYSSLYLYEFSKVLLDIYEKKLFLSCGYETLEEYTFECFGIKKSQAYKHINLAKKYSLEFFHSNGKIGVTKLDLLIDLGSEEEIKEFIQDNDVENMSVKELENKIEDLTIKLDSKNKEISELNSNINELKNRSNNPEEIIKEIFVTDETKVKELEEKILGLEILNKELTVKLEKKVDQPDADILEIKNLEKQIKTLTAEKKKLSSDLKDAEKKLILTSNEDYNKFKAQFLFLKTAVEETRRLVLSFDDSEFVSKCKTALKALYEGALK